MKYLLILFLFGLSLAGCGAIGTSKKVPQKAASGPTAVADRQDAVAASGALAVTVGPPFVPVAPGPGTPASDAQAGWKTFASAGLGVAVDYPGDWSLNEQAGGEKFTSPQGDFILLHSDSGTSSSSAMGQGCSSVVNSYGQVAELCYDAATFRYSASFKKTGTGATGGVTLSIVSRQRPTVYFQMFDSLRPIN